jgi:hypothetical protein
MVQLQPSDLTTSGKLDAAAIDAAHLNSAALLSALTSTTIPEQLAALAVIAGRDHSSDCQPALLGLLGRDGLVGRCAAWAIGQLATAGDAAIEQALLKIVESGDLDTRENGYLALAVLAARSVGSAQLPQALTACVEAEVARAMAGKSGLGEHPCRILAILGASGLPELLKSVGERDRYTDRFELQRLRKAIEDSGRDTETQRLLTGPWQTLFADAIHVPAAPPVAPPAKTASAPASGAGITAVPPTGGKAAASPPPAPGAPTGDAGTTDELGAPDDGGTPAPPIDWKAFLASPEAKALPPQVQQMAAQLGPLLEQLSNRAIRAALSDLTGQEFAGLILQVLPQALPPQHAQMALSPPAINAYQAIAKYLARTLLATHGQDLLEGVKLVRRELVNQIRQSGILGGPDYSDPDDKPSIAKS